MVTLNTVCRRHPAVRFRVVDGQAVVLQQNAAELTVLDEIATHILSLADGVAPVSAWVEVLGRQYEVEREILERDLVDFASELIAAGLLEAMPPAVSASLPPEGP
jgi:hypothetical protein